MPSRSGKDGPPTMPATARLQHLTGVLTAPDSPQSPVAPSPTVTSFPSGLVNSSLLPGFLTVDSPVTPPAWATQMVSLLEQQTRACEVFYDYYFDEHDGQMEMYPR